MSLTRVPERIALCRISEGRIALSQGRYFDHGRRVPGYLSAVLESLLEREVAVLTEAGADPWRRVALTPAGQAYHETLCAPSPRHPDPPPGRPPFRVGTDPAGHRDCPHGVQPGPAPDLTVAATPPQIPTVF